MKRKYTSTRTAGRYASSLLALLFSTYEDENKCEGGGSFLKGLSPPPKKFTKKLSYNQCTCSTDNIENCAILEYKRVKLS